MKTQILMLAYPKKCSKYTPKALFIIQDVLANNSSHYTFEILMWALSTVIFTNYVTLIGSWTIYQLSAKHLPKLLLLSGVHFLSHAELHFAVKQSSEVFYLSNQSWSAAIVLPKTSLSLTKFSFFYPSSWSVANRSIDYRANLKTRGFFVDFCYLMYTSWFQTIPLRVWWLNHQNLSWTESRRMFGRLATPFKSLANQMRVSIIVLNIVLVTIPDL